MDRRFAFPTQLRSTRCSAIGVQNGLKPAGGAGAEYVGITTEWKPQKVSDFGFFVVYRSGIGFCRECLTEKLVLFPVAVGTSGCTPSCG